MEEEVYTGAYMQKLLEPNADFNLYISKSIKLFLNEPDDVNLKLAIENVMDGREKNPEVEGQKIAEEKVITETKEETETKEKAETEEKVETKRKTEGEQKKENSWNENNNDDNKNNGNCNNNKEESEKEDERIKEDTKENAKTNEESLGKEQLEKELGTKLSLIKGYHYFHKIGFIISQLHTELASIKKDFLLLDKEANDIFKKLKLSKKKKMVYQDLLDQVKEERKRAEIYEQLSIEIQKLDDVQSVKEKQKQQKESIKKIKKKIKKAKQITTFNDSRLLKTLEHINNMITSTAPTDSI